MRDDSHWRRDQDVVDTGHAIDLRRIGRAAWRDGIMTTAITLAGNTTSTFLTHFFGSGLSDNTQVVEQFRAMLDGDVRRCTDDEPPASKKGRRKTKYDIDILREH